MITTRKIQEQLTKNLLPQIIFDILKNHPMCGYEIISTIKKTYGVTLGASTMYPTLDKLESEDLVRGEWNLDNIHPKKVYKLTREGLEILTYSVNSLIQICNTFDNANQKLEKKMQYPVLIAIK